MFASNRRDFLKIALASCVGGGCAGPDKQLDDSFSRPLPSLNRPSAMSELSRKLIIDGWRDVLRTKTDHEIRALIDSKKNEPEACRLMLAALSAESTVEIRNHEKTRRYVAALKYFKDGCKTPDMARVWIDAVAEEQTARFVRSIKIANEGGEELLVGLAWRDPRRARIVALRIEQDYLDPDLVLKAILNKQPVLVEARPNVAALMRAVARDSEAMKQQEAP